MMNLLTDMAFNLLIFFVVLADPSSETGRSQQIPAAKDESSATEQPQSIKIELSDPDKTGNRLVFNGEPITMDELPGKLAPLLEGKQKPEDRIVVVDCKEQTPYHWFIRATGRIEQAGGVVALQLEETKEVTVPGTK